MDEQTKADMEGGGGCNTASLAPAPVDDWMESEVIMGFRVWQLMFLALAGLITVVVLLCCFMKCRVPRTKQEIEADFKRKEITRRFRFLLDRVQIEDTSLRTAIEKVNELYMNREKTKRRKKKKATIEEEEIISIDSSYLFEDEKLTFVGRIKKMVGLIKEEGSDSEGDSQKDKSEKSEDNITKRASDDDDESSLPNVHTVAAATTTTKARQFSEESRESSDSPKLSGSQSRLIESHSKLSIMQDSPPRTHDTLSKLSFLQDSPPNNGLSLLQDTPPNMRKLNKEESGATDSQDSKKTFGKQKTESQESHESELSTKKQDSQDSDIRSPRPKLSFILSTKGKHKKPVSDSQDSEDSQLMKLKSDSQDSNESEKSKKQKSDSQDSNESGKSKNKKIFEPRDSKLVRRESMGGQNAQDFIHKWGQKPSQLNKTKGFQKETQSLDVTPTSH